MKKTFNILGAAVLSVAVLFGANSCNNTEKKNEAAKANTTDTTNVVLAPAGSIVFVDMTKVMKEYEMAVKLEAEVQKKVDELQKGFMNKQQSAEKELKRKQNNLQAKAKDFEDKYKKGHLTETNAQAKMQEIQGLENDLANYAAKKEKELATEGAKVEAEIQDELIVMNNKVNDAINTFIQKYRVEKGYSMIIISQSDMDTTDKAMILSAPVISADPSFDVTSEVVAGLNAEYKESKE